MTIEDVPGHPATYRLISFDADGRERPEDDGLGSVQALDELAGCSDVVVLSHGWQGDVPGARRQYGRWIAEMLDRDDRAAPLRARAEGFRARIIGLHWPSKAWGEEELGDAGYGVSTAGPAGQAADHPADPGTGVPESLVGSFVARLEDRPETRAAVRTLLEVALVDPAPRTLPPEAVAAYTELDRQLRGGADGNGAAPGDDREPFDAERMYQACRLAQAASFGGPSLGGLLAPLRTLTFWHMKRRANRFGESGAARLLDDIQRTHRDVRIHLMGHSFGCIVTTSAVAGPRSAPRTVPVASLTLIQGAMSLWSFCPAIPSNPRRSGYFRRVVADGLVSGPVLASTSHHDRAVRTFYSIAASMAKQVEYAAGSVVAPPKYGGIGTWGIQGLEPGARPETLAEQGTELHLAPGEVVNLDATSVIAHGTGPSGAHSDICHPAVADAVWQAIVCGSLSRP